MNETLKPVVTEEQNKRNRKISAIALALFSLTILLMRCHTYDEPLSRDIALYSVIGHEMLAGRALYTDMWDNKPPAIYVVYAAAESVAGYNKGAMYLLFAVATIGTLIALYFIGFHYGGLAGGIWAGVFWTILSGSLSLQGNEPNGEMFMNTCLACGFAGMLGSRGTGYDVLRFLLVGALFATASVFKQNAIFPVFLFCLCHIAFPGEPGMGPRWKAFVQVCVIGAVGIAAWAAVIEYFVMKGTLKDFIDSIVTYNKYYSYKGSLVKNTILFFVPKYPRVQLEFIRSMHFGILLGMFALIGMFRGWRANPRSWVLLGGYLVASLFAITASGRFFPHYYQLFLPPFIIGAAWMLSDAWNEKSPLRSKVLRAMGPIALTLILAHEIPTYSLSPNEWSHRKYGSAMDVDFAAAEKLGREIRTLLKPGETFYEWGDEPELYFISKVKPPTGILFIKHMLDGPLHEEFTDRMIRDFKRNRPELLVLVSGVAMYRREGEVYDEFRKDFVPMPGNPRRGRFLLYVRRGGALEARIKKRLPGAAGSNP